MDEKAPVDLLYLDLRRHDALDVEQRKAERRGQVDGVLGEALPLGVKLLVAWRSEGEKGPEKSGNFAFPFRDLGEKLSVFTLL